MPIDYRSTANQLRALLDGETDRLACTANFVALLQEHVPDVNWVGIYVRRGQELVLGPFQGRPACVRIPFGQGVCGTAAAERRTLRVADVHEFDGHIACDPASNAELVVPLVVHDEVIGVLDIDSPTAGRFSQADERGVEHLCAIYLDAIDRSAPPGGGFI